MNVVNNGNKWEAFARTLIELRFPSAEYEYFQGKPRRRDEKGNTLVGDWAVYKYGGATTYGRRFAPMSDERLVCIVEVGQLSSPGKLEEWERLFPDVTIWWLPKSDIIRYLFPKMERFRFDLAKDRARLVTRLTDQVIGFHAEARVLRDSFKSLVSSQMEVYQRTKLQINEMCRAIKSIADDFSRLEQTISSAGSALLDKFDANQSLFEASIGEETQHPVHAEEEVTP